MKTSEKSYRRPDSTFPQSQKQSQTNSIKHSTVFSKKDIDKSVKSIYKKTSILLDNLASGNCVFSIEGKIVKLKPIDTVKAISSLEVDNELELVIRNIILNSALSVDRKSLGSAFVFLNFLIKGISLDKSPWFFRATEKDCLKVLETYNGQSLTSNIVKRIIEISGLRSKVFFNFSSDSNFNIRSFKGKVISAKKHEIFTSKVTQLENVKVLFVDGILESIGELEYFLQSCASLKTPVLMISTGWSPDIVSTLNKNYELGKLKVIPAVIENIDSEQLENFCVDNNFDIFTPKINSDIRKLDINQLTTFSDVILEKNSITISSDSGEYSTEIRIPYSLKSVSGFIKDKVLLSYHMVSELSKSGVAFIESNDNSKDIFIPASCVNLSIDATKNTEELIFNLHRVIKT